MYEPLPYAVIDQPWPKAPVVVPESTQISIVGDTAVDEARPPVVTHVEAPLVV